MRRVLMWLGLLCLVAVGCAGGEEAGRGEATSMMPAPTQTSEGGGATAAPPTDTAASATASPTPAVEIMLEKVEGTCEEFNEYALTTGLTDGKGTNHPGVVGWTDSRLGIDTSYAVRPAEGSEQGEVCFETGELQVGLSLTATVTRLEWVPPQAPSPECEMEIARWEREVIEHEMEHVEDVRATVREASDQLPSKTYRACGATRQEAQQKLQEEISNDLNSKLSNLSRTLEQKAEEFHSSREGGPTQGLDCGVCR